MESRSRFFALVLAVVLASGLGAAHAVSPPVCTLSATPSTLPAGFATTISFVANCTNSPTSYVWQSPVGAPTAFGTGAGANTATASFPANTPIGTYNYAVNASNAAGSSFATATVTVTTPPAPVSCQPLAQVPGIGGGGYSSVVRYPAGGPVSIDPNDCRQTTYSALWTPTGQTTPVLATSAPGPGAAQTYTLTTTSASLVKRGTVTVLGALIGTPICTLSAPTTSVFAGQPVTITATCSPAATSFNWSGSSAGYVTLVSGAGTNQATYIFLTATGPNVRQIVYLSTSNASGGGADYAAGFIVSAAPVVMPACTLTAAPNAFLAGAATNVSLAASCTNSPASYQWSSSAGAPAVSGTGAAVTASFPATVAAGTYTYSVTATNAGGTSAPATATVTVNPATAAPPVCTLAATPSTLASGTAATVNLVASCTNSPTSYDWAASAGAPSVSGSGSAVTAAFPASTSPGTYTYYVNGRNAVGAGPVASATVTVNASTSATPGCILSAPLSILAGRSVTLAASCNPAATSYAWTGGTCAGTNGPSCVATPTETTTYTVTGRNGSGTGKTASAIVLVTRPAFEMSVTSNVTAATTTASVHIQPRAEDAGAAANVFVFAHVPSSSLSGARKLEGPDPCVLAQLDASGHWVAVTPSNMQVHSTLSSSQTVTILNGVPTPSVAGASFYVGYGTSASTMFSSGTYEAAVSIPGNGSVCTATPLAAAAPNSPGALSGLWWNAGESGWGVHFTQRRNIVFAAWYTYDASGNPKWYVASSCTLPAGNTGTSGTCTGTLYEVSGPAFLGAPFNASAVNVVVAGSMQVNFQNANSASLTYQVNGQSRTVALSRQSFAAGNAPPAVDFTDLWWNPNESGWGLSMTEQYGVMFLAWFVYDNAGKPVWYVASNCVMKGTSCTGDLYQTTGPPLGPSFNPAAVQVSTVGTITVNFMDANNATITYTANGISGTKSITRQAF